MSHIMMEREKRRRRGSESMCDEGNGKQGKEARWMIEDWEGEKDLFCCPPHCPLIYYLP